VFSARTPTAVVNGRRSARGGGLGLLGLAVRVRELDASSFRAFRGARVPAERRAGVAERIQAFSMSTSAGSSRERAQRTTSRRQLHATPVEQALVTGTEGPFPTEE